MPETPEQKGRREIDTDLGAAGWMVQDLQQIDLTGGRGIAVPQAILSHAFTGQLPPQDPNDEPASELLKRISAEREARLKAAAPTRWKTRKVRRPGRKA